MIKQSLQHGTGARERSTIEEGVDLIHLTNVYGVHLNVELKFMNKKILVGFPPGIVAVLSLLPFGGSSSSGSAWLREVKSQQARVNSAENTVILVQQKRAIYFFCKAGCG